MGAKTRSAGRHCGETAMLAGTARSHARIVCVRRRRMLKRAGLIILIVILFIAMFTFTALNTGEIQLDLAFFEGTYPISVVLAATFAIGILFGMLCMTAFVIRLINERRTLRRSLRMTESEVSSLRNLPLSDAD